MYTEEFLGAIYFFFNLQMDKKQTFKKPVFAELVRSKRKLNSQSVWPINPPINQSLSSLPSSVVSPPRAPAIIRRRPSFLNEIFNFYFLQGR